jgi:hypothetical protein
MHEARVGFRSYHHVALDNDRLSKFHGYVNGGEPHGSLRPPQLLFSRDRFLIKYRRTFSRRVLSPSIRKDVKVTIADRSWVTELAAAKAERMNDEAQAIFSRTDEPGHQRKILDANGGET